MIDRPAESIPVRTHLSNSLDRIRSTPRLLALGFATAMGAAWLVLLSPVVFEVTRSLAGTLLVAGGQGQVGTYQVSVSRVAAATVQTVLAVPGSLVALSFVWLLAGIAGGAVVRPSATAAGDRLSGDELARVLTHGLGRRAVSVPVWVTAWVTLLGVYFSAGTAVEATGYALGLYDPLPAAVPVVVLVATLVGACGVTVAVVGFVDTAALSGDEGSFQSLLAGTLSYALGHPWRVVRHSAVLAVLLGTPFLGPVAFLAVDIGLDLSTPRYAVIGVVGGSVLLIGTVTYTLSAVYRTEVFETEVGPALARRRERESAPGIRSQVPWGRVALAGLVVAGLVVGGSAVRAAGIAPDGSADHVPGPVTGDDPRAEIEQGFEALDGGERRVESRTYGANVSDGSLPDAWSDHPSMVVEHRVDPGRAARLDGMVVKTGPDDEDGTYMQTSIYATRTEVAVGTASVETDDEVQLATDAIEWHTDGAILPHHFWTVVEGTPMDGMPFEWLSPAGDWKHVETTDSAVVYRAEGLESIVEDDSLGARSNRDPEIVEAARAFVHLDRETGVVREVRYEVVQSYEVGEEIETNALREVYTVEAHGDVDLGRPDGVSRDPLTLLVEAIFY